MKLDKVIYEMLTENTGSHFLDSGDHYGRHYERNATKTLRDFKAEPVEKVTKSGGYYEREVSVFHYLMNMGIEVTPLCKQFNKYNVGSGDWDGEVYGVSAKAWEWLTSNYEVRVEKSFNTYNHDCDLSQVLQGTNLIINSERYMTLQVHNGCDVRGGYTDARLFHKTDYWDNYIPDWKSQTEIEEEINMGMIKLDEYGA